MSRTFSRVVYCGAFLCLFFSADSLRADLIGYWPLDGDASATVGLDGTINGSLAPTFDMGFTPGGALNFDGASWIDVPGGGGLDGAALGSISMWVQWLGMQDAACCGSFGNVLSRQSNGFFSNNILGLSGADPTTATLTWQQSGAGTPTITGTTPVGENWVHVGVTFSGFGSELYLNGVSQGTGFGATLSSDPTLPLSIGSWSGDGAGFATANIDDVAVFDDYLSAAQMADLASGTATPLTVGPGGPGPMPPEPPLAVANVIASSEFSGRPAINTVNGLGLQPDFSHVATPATTMWLTQNNDPAPYIGFDLGSEHTLDTLRIWNYNENANPTCCLNRGVADANILVAGEDGQFFTLYANQALDIAPGTATDFSQTVDLGRVQARYVLIESNANHGDTYTGLSEVQFQGQPAGSSSVQLPLPATIESASSGLGGNFARFAENLVNGSGWFANWHSIVPDGSMWLSNGTFAEPNDIDPEIVFDLGGEQALDHVRIWNYNETLPGRDDLLNRGTSELELLVAGEDQNFVSLGTIQLTKAPGDSRIDFSEIFDLGGVEARYVKFDNFVSYGGDNGFVGLSEVQFFAVIPEPSSLALVATLLIGLLVRRRAA